MSFFLDLFHDPAGEFTAFLHLEDHLPDIGGAWIQDGFSGPYLGFQGTDAVTIAFGGDAVYYNDLDLATADYEFEIEVQNQGAGAISDDIYVAIRHQVSTRNRYQVKYKYADSTVWLQKVTSDIAVDVDGPFHIADWDPPLDIVIHTLKVKAVGDTITGYVDGVLRFTYVDPFPIVNPGTVGIGGYRTVGEPLYIVHAVATGTYVAAPRTGIEIAGRKVGRNLFRSMEWTDERYGGFWDWSAEINAAFADPAQFHHGDMVEFWWKGQRRYRGYIRGIDKKQDDPQSFTISGYGPFFHPGKFDLEHPIVYGQPKDASIMFSDIIAQAVLPFLPDTQVDAQLTGVFVQRVEAQYKTVKEVVQDVGEAQGENRLLFGGDVDILDHDQLFMRPFSTVVDFSLKIPGLRVGKGGSQTQTGDIVNRLKILGGKPLHPNLIFNSSFERPRVGGDEAGNLLSHGGFEPEGVETQSSSGGLQSPWSGTGSYKSNGHDEGNAFSGSWMVETDNNGENFHQTRNPPPIAVVPGHDYNFSAYAKIEVENTNCVGRFRVEWLDSGGGVLQTDDVPAPIYNSGITPSLSATWQRFLGTGRAPALATGVKATGSIVSGGSVGHGILWDEIEIYDATTVFQDQWEVGQTGSGVATSVNWAFLDAFDGGYSVYIKATSLDDDANEVTLQSLGRKRFDIQGGAEYDFSCYVKNAPGETVTPKLRLVIEEYDKDGKLVGSRTTADLAGGAHVDWTQFHATRTFAQTSVYAVAYLAIRGTGAFLVDAFCFRDHAALLSYVRDGDSNAFVKTIRADDPILLSTDPVISDAAADSINQYEVWPGVETQDLITTDADAYAYAAAFFNAHAVPFPLPNVEVFDDDRFFRPGQLIRALGEDGLALFDGPSGQETSLPIARCRWVYDGMLKGTLELQKEVPDLAEQLLKKLRKSIGVKDTSTASSSISGGQPPSPPVQTSLTVREIDASPEITGVDTLEFPNGTVFDEGGGVARYDPSVLFPLPSCAGQILFSDDGIAWMLAKPVISGDGNVMTTGEGKILVTGAC